jgi:DNA-binding response OmpR family regulator
MIKVLLVEDEPTLSYIIRDTLSDQGFSVDLACDGEEALALLNVSCPDVVVADVMMPRMDGFEMLKRIRRGGNQTPVLFLLLVRL